MGKHGKLQIRILQRYCKLVILDTLGMSGYAHLKRYYQLVENFCVYLTGKKSTLSSIFSWRYCIYMQTSYFGYFGYVMLCKPKMIVSNCGKLQCLSACQKINFIIHFFIGVLYFKESCSLIDQQHFDP